MAISEAAMGDTTSCKGYSKHHEHCTVWECFKLPISTFRLSSSMLCFLNRQFAAHLCHSIQDRLCCIAV